MTEDQIRYSLPADLPENWQFEQTIAPNGKEVGLSEQHGYNYLMKQVNAAQVAINQLSQTRPVVLIGGTAPAKGPCIWFDTSQAQTQFAVLQLGEEVSTTAVLAEIDAQQHSVDNAQLRTDPETGSYEIEIL